MALLTGMTEDGREVPVQVDGSGRLVAEGLMGPAGPAGPTGPSGPAGDPSVFTPGTAQSPGLSPVGSPGTGLFAGSANSLSVSTNGTERLEIKDDGAIGIGGPLGDAQVSLHGDLNLVSSGVGAGRSVRLYSNSLGEHYGAVEWFNTQWNGEVRAAIRVYTRHGVMQGGLSFCTSPDGTEAKERLWISPEGDLELSPASKIRAEGLAARVHADNAAAKAAGLVAGDFYRKADGTLMVAY